MLAFGQDSQPVARFHHLHLNATDQAAAIAFYTGKFESQKARFGGAIDAVWAHKSWLLFDKVAAPPPAELTSSVWHFGWGAEDMKAEYQKQLDSGTKFFTPLTDISDLARVPGFFYAYVQGPDGALIELNTARHHRFGHLHLFSEDPVAAGEWYAKHFGATPRGFQREPRLFRDHPVGPSASLMIDDVNIIIYPVAYTRKAYPEHWKPGQTTLAPTRGRVVDHIAFSFDNLAAAVQKFRTAGVKITDEIRVIPGTSVKSAFIEGPDQIRIELVEGHAEPPQPAAAQRASLPEFVHGDECLFCHRNDIGPGWQKDRHARTVRQKEDAPEEFLLGSRQNVRELKRAGYGKFAILEKSGWDNQKFANRCAGCHTTAVDSKTREFAAFGLDCYTCHGVVPLEHSKDKSLALLSQKRRDEVHVVTSICASCHLRGGRSRSTGLPYPNNFVAGDDLFQDFEVNAAEDAHVLRAVRSQTNCLSCHVVHLSSSRKHRFVAKSEICYDCHAREGPMKVVKREAPHSATCEY